MCIRYVAAGEQVLNAGDDSDVTGPFGKRYFHNLDGWPTGQDAGPVYAGIVTPAVHYTMGGVTIDKHAQVQQADSSGPVLGLYAAGEVVGGIHGENRLGGNALTEALVFGRVAAKSIVDELSTIEATDAHHITSEGYVLYIRRLDVGIHPLVSSVGRSVDTFISCRFCFLCCVCWFRCLNTGIGTSEAAVTLVMQVQVWGQVRVVANSG